MKKKILAAALLAGIVGQANAAGPHTGFSIGVNLGVEDADGKLNRNFFDPNVVPPANATDNSNWGGRSPVLGLLLGYGWSPHPNGVYLGAEIFGQVEGINAKRQDFIGNFLVGFSGLAMQLKTTSTWGGSVKLGYVCKDALWFLKLGAASTRWKMNLTDLTPNTGVTFSTNSNKTGFLFGLGMDYAIARHWSLGGEYIYTMYSAIKLAGADRTAGGAGFNASYKPNVGTFNLRLKYTF